MAHPILGPAIRFGGDYNPDQWPRHVWAEDVKFMRDAGVNLATIGVFAWVTTEPKPGQYDFTFLDEVIGMLAEAGIDVDLATPTAAPPAWLNRAHPEARVVTAEGHVLDHGSRGMMCPHSPAYREACAGIATALAERYGTNPAVVLWHVHNEYGVPISQCHCEVSAAAFRTWLENRYVTLDALNEAWGTAFWGQRYGEWEEISTPRLSGTSVNPSQRLDFARFNDETIRECYILERDIIKRHSDKPVTTNFMVSNLDALDYWKWAREVDVVATDYYLAAADPRNYVGAAFESDLTRSIAGGRPWLLMEHSSSAVNWQPHNVAKTPGEEARTALTHLGRGSDSVLFFQWRASRRGSEKFHSAMLPHAGTESRVWREICDLGQGLSRVENLAGSLVSLPLADDIAETPSGTADEATGPMMDAALESSDQPVIERSEETAIPGLSELTVAPATFRPGPSLTAGTDPDVIVDPAIAAPGPAFPAAILVDWESLWAQSLGSQPSTLLDPRQRAHVYYDWLYRHFGGADFVHPEGDLSPYRLVVVPSSYLMSEATAERLTAFARSGGIVVVAGYTAAVDEHDAVHAGGFAAPLRSLLGLVVEEYTPVRVETALDIVPESGAASVSDFALPARIWAEDLRLETAETAWRFSGGPQHGRAAITRHPFGDGEAWYVATELTADGLATALRPATDGLTPALAQGSAAGDVERLRRVADDGAEFVFVINHTGEAAPLLVSGTDAFSGETVDADDEVAAGGSRIIRTA
ncbi:MAG: beta-galactosidase [Propionibacteriaceae bacterium]|jgi:beta-galactosidase GanA|nr:beta-galactosidase [Propionibacteriaceae bacterium]